MPSAPKWLFDVVEGLLPKLPLAKVVTTEYLTRSVKRIRFEGDFRNLKVEIGNSIDFRVSDTDVRRYTPAFVDIENGMLDLIAHIHGEAPGSQFMHNLKTGDQVNLNTPRGHNYYNASVPNHVIFGDETSLAVALLFLPALKRKAHKFRFYFELEDENRDVPEALGIENCMVFSKKGRFKDENWLREWCGKESSHWQDANFILTGDAKSVQTFRKVLKNRVNGKIHSHGYWMEGKTGL